MRAITANSLGSAVSGHHTVSMRPASLVTSTCACTDDRTDTFCFANTATLNRLSSGLLSCSKDLLGGSSRPRYAACTAAGCLQSRGQQTHLSKCFGPELPKALSPAKVLIVRKRQHDVRDGGLNHCSRLKGQGWPRGSLTGMPSGHARL